MRDQDCLRQLAELRRAQLRLKSEIAWLRFMEAFSRFAIAAVVTPYRVATTSRTTRSPEALRY